MLTAVPMSLSAVHHEMWKRGSVGVGWPSWNVSIQTEEFFLWPPILYQRGDQKKEGIYWVKTWTALLAEIFHPGKQINIWKEDLRENERVRKCERVTERNDVLIQALSREGPQHYAGIYVSGGYPTKVEKPAHLYQILHSFMVWL